MKYIGLTIILILSVGCIYDKPVYRFPPIAEEYHKCNKCQSYAGGIWGKGVPRYYKSNLANKCQHKWHQIKVDQFAIEVNKKYNIDWSIENGFFKNLQKHIKQ